MWRTDGILVPAISTLKPSACIVFVSLVGAHRKIVVQARRNFKREHSDREGSSCRGGGIMIS